MFYFSQNNFIRQKQNFSNADDDTNTFVEIFKWPFSTFSDIAKQIRVENRLLVKLHAVWLLASFLDTHSFIGACGKLTYVSQNVQNIS